MQNDTKKANHFNTLKTNYLYLVFCLFTAKIMYFFNRLNENSIGFKYKTNI
jgi:hypothetical protein